eukprot:CAMPEP_0206173088 /NCGR_PEP_ID=MMETSP1474-20131121/47751_1 /ASSEMBLY_ACC=CAM_ASM_001110 /TAXON_ID=97495 /ORGANISM="Imantonia sp., Strain RCC918" /LENGTH=66 /DNA_ID=CAMNT_0053581675 /DNA_START=76 /DNA_END=277 /DNA_ORIENTATION=+
MPMWTADLSKRAPGYKKNDKDERQNGEHGDRIHYVVECQFGAGLIIEEEETREEALRVGVGPRQGE